MKKLYVGKLPFEATEQNLRDWFVKAGFNVENVTLIRDRDSNQPRGFGFVEIHNDDEAERAIRDLNGKEFLARALVINEARPRGEGGRGGGDRGRGRYRGGW